MVNEAIEVMTDYFHTMPKSEVVVKAVPEYSEATQAGGYYQAPALDGLSLIHISEPTRPY